MSSSKTTESNTAPSFTKEEDMKIINCIIGATLDVKPKTIAFWTKCRESGMDLPLRSDESLKGRFIRLSKNFDQLSLSEEKLIDLHSKLESVPKSAGKPIRPFPGLDSDANEEPPAKRKLKAHRSATDKKQSSPKNVKLDPKNEQKIQNDGEKSLEILEYQRFYCSKLIEIMECEVESERIQWYKDQTRRAINSHCLLPWISEISDSSTKSVVEELVEKLSMIIDVTMCPSAQTNENIRESGLFIRELIEDANIMVGFQRTLELKKKEKEHDGSSKRVQVSAIVVAPSSTVPNGNVCGGTAEQHQSGGQLQKDIQVQLKDSHAAEAINKAISSILEDEGDAESQE